MTTTTETGTFWDRAAETMPREQLEKLQAERVKSCLRTDANLGGPVLSRAPVPG